MDLAAHALAEGGIDHAVAGKRQLAGERGAHHGRLEMHAIVAAHLRAGAGQAGFDQVADGVCVHGGVGVLA